MSTTFDDNERSTSQNRPVELYTITTPTVTYRLTTSPVDVVYSGDTFTATTMNRGNLQVTQDPTGREFVVYLPISHPLVQRFASTGLPESQVLVKLQRLQTVSGIAVQMWLGLATGLSVDDHIATLRIPSATDNAMKIKLPVIRAQRLCNHTLFDIGCAPAPGTDGPDRASFSVATTVVSQVIAPGVVTINIASMAGHPDQWATFGELVHDATEQRLMVLAQVGTVLTVNMPIVGVVGGDAVTVYAGCAHDVITCRDKFANAVNFGGMPEINGSFAPWDPGSKLGSVQQP